MILIVFTLFSLPLSILLPCLILTPSTTGLRGTPQLKFMFFGHTKNLLRSSRTVHKFVCLDSRARVPAE